MAQLRSGKITWLLKGASGKEFHGRKRPKVPTTCKEKREFLVQNVSESLLAPQLELLPGVCECGCVAV